MSLFLRILFLVGLKTLSRLFFYFKVEWVGGKPRNAFKDVHLLVLLNHTSLFEPLFTGTVPVAFLGEIGKRGVLPTADLTANRPVVGRIFRYMVPNSVSITRLRDSSWARFLSKIDQKSMVMLFPEGRMKRPSGMDKSGKPMTVRAGVTEVLGMLDSGNIMFLYSGGLHHIQAPGQGFPHLFKKIRVRFEMLQIKEYKEQMGFPSKVFMRNVIADMERRRDIHCVWEDNGS